MNASLSDGNEPVIDIFVLSVNSSLSAQLEKQLRDEGYYVTLFSDGTHLLETLRNGKPNLLVCDTTASNADAFEVCRQIKADDYLWNIPVLVLTGASDLADLLRVLDCNADNFIAHPFDPPYLLSLIEGMLTTPVERQTPEQIKTQFKIKHEEQVFVVTADRRKLLEFLLSSFEIAVNKSADLSQVQEEKENLGQTIRKLEEDVREQTKVIGIINETLKTKEQKLIELTGQLADREASVQEKTATIDQLSRDLAAEQADHKAAEDEIRRVVQEKDESIAAHMSTIGQLQRQVTDLSSELGTVKPALERTQEELVAESNHRKDVESELSALAAVKEQVDKALRALTVEYEQMKASFGAEKNRASEAEQELSAVLQAKTQAEQDLTQVINDLKNAAKQQAEEINRLREESDYGHTRLSLTEENLRTVTAAKEQSEASLREAIDAGLKNIARLQEQLDTAGKVLDEREQAIASLNADLASAVSAHKEANTALDAERQESASQKEDLARVHAEKEKAEALAESLTASLKESQEQNRDNEERMNAIIQQRDGELQELQKVHEETKNAFSSHRITLEQVKQDLDAAVLARTNLEEKMEQVQMRLEQENLRRQEAEDQLKEALSQQQQMEQDLEHLVSETKTLHADLVAEKKDLEALKKEKEVLEEQNRALEERASDLTRKKHEAEQAAADLTAEIDQARVALADEWEDHMKDNERLFAATSEKQGPISVPPRREDIEPEKTRKRALIIKVPEVPSGIRPLPRSMVAVDPAKAPEPEASHIRSVEDLFEDDEDKESAGPEVSIVKEPATEPVQDILPDTLPGPSDSNSSFFEDDTEPATSAQDDTGKDEPGGEQSPSGISSDAPVSGHSTAIDREQWLDLLKWSHHCDALTQDQRMQIVRMGRLIQKGRKLTKRQEEQVVEMIALVQRLGYRIP
jgi:DNA-binding response OmpR family regulator